MHSIKVNFIFIEILPIFIITSSIKSIGLIGIIASLVTDKFPNISLLV